MIKFPWTKRIEKLQEQIWTLQGELNGHREDSVSRIEFGKLSNTVSEDAGHVNTFNSNYHDIFNGHILRIEKLESKVKSLEKEILSRVKGVENQLDPFIEKYVKELEDLKHRLGKTELMHAATSKKQNELFDNAMSKMIDAYSRFSIHISTLAEQKIAEISDFVGIPDLRKESVLIAINGQPETFDSNEISYNDILERFLFHFPNKKDSAPYSIVYEDGGDESKPFGTMTETDILAIKTGTVVNVSIISANGG